MKKENTEFCGSCRFWLGIEEAESENQEGACRRSPPTIHVDKSNRQYYFFKGYWPGTQLLDWCGEYQEG